MRGLTDSHGGELRAWTFCLGLSPHFPADQLGDLGQGTGILPEPPVPISVGVRMVPETVPGMAWVLSKCLSSFFFFFLQP